MRTHFACRSSGCDVCRSGLRLERQGPHGGRGIGVAEADARAAPTAIKVLSAHPHYQEFLAADQPGNMPEDEWVFLRAATWSDWIRNHHAKEFSHPNWHFIDLPYVPPGSHLKPEDYPPAKPNVVTQIPVCIEKVQSGTAEEKAVYLCWLLHLVGDIHQPLHCTTLFSEEFPEGDRAKLGSSANRQRPTDQTPPDVGRLLGKAVSVSSIRGTVREVQALAEQERKAVDRICRRTRRPTLGLKKAWRTQSNTPT